MTQLPLRPYAGTSGWSGSNTSQERAKNEDNNGTTSQRQAIVLKVLEDGWLDGVTWKELASRFGWHHGQASGALSVLHKEGLIARLTETRQRCKVYVLPEFVDGRPTEPHGSNKRHNCPACGYSF